MNARDRELPEGTQVVVGGSFDDLRLRHVRFLEEAAKFGDLNVLLWTDAHIEEREGTPPAFPEEERLYFLQAIRWVSRVTRVTDVLERDTLPARSDDGPYLWVVDEVEDNETKREFCKDNGYLYHVVSEEELAAVPSPPRSAADALPFDGTKVVVTGCYDWFHSGHVRFFEEVSALGALYVVVGSDANVTHLKGEGHPMFPQDERWYMVRSIRHVRDALVSSGHGWMDAEPEIAVLKPDVYAVNEDGDKPEKREFCEKHGLQYAVLKRTPKEGLPRRESTKLRGF
jgi:cytidyltransferase-like protein